MNVMEAPVARRTTQKYNKPLKLVVNASTAHDPLALAQRSIRETLNFHPGRFNVLEVMDVGHPRELSYSGLPVKDIKLCMQGDILDAQGISEMRDVLEGAHEFVIMGGPMNRDIKWAMASIMVLNLYAMDPKVVDLFGEDTGKQRHAAHFMAQRSDAGFNGHSDLTFHFNLRAIFPHFRDMENRDDKNLTKPVQKFESWEDVAMYAAIDGTYEEIYEAVLRNMPEMNHHLLRATGYNVLGYIDGNECRDPVSKGGNDSPNIRLYYWSSTAALAEYFITHPT